jgi:galactose oxidase-like protein
MNTTMVRLAGALALVAGVTACRDAAMAPRASLTTGPRFELQDGAHNSGNGHFYFLPPVTPQPVFTGSFDPSLEPIVRICEWTGSACLSPSLAEFTATTGPGAETVRVDVADELYVVNWHTDRLALDAIGTYRIYVFVSGTELGHADVDVLSSGKDRRSVAVGAFVPLLRGQTLPIKFRIEQGALPAALPSWIQLAPSGGPPGYRDGHSAVYDPSSGRMIVFGGFRNGIGYVNDLWILSDANGVGATPSWAEIAPGGIVPPGRGYHSAVLDVASNRMIVFGGYGGNNGVLNDVWVLSNASGVGGTPTWAQLQPAGTPPAARFYHTAVYDPGTNRMMVFAGGNLAGGVTDVYADVWLLMNANGLGGTPTWMQLGTTGASPAARYLHSAVYDAGSNRMTVFAGIGAGSLNLDDVWVLVNANGVAATPSWTELAPTGEAPLARYGHSAVYDASSNCMTVFGGADSYTLDNQVWILSNANGAEGVSPMWAELAPSGTPPVGREGHSAVYDPASARMTVFAGVPDLNDT